MKRLLPLLLLLAACNSNKKDKTADQVPSIQTPKPDSANVVKDAHYFWAADLPARGPMAMKKVEPVSADNLNVTYMLSRLNQIYPEIRLEMDRSSGDTVFLKIRNAKYFTQQMGSTGAEAYMAEVTYNMTEVPNIDYVHFSFKEGDHAAPGTYSRTDFVR